MALRRLSMRKIHTTLRLFFEAGLSIRAIARTLRVSPEVPAKAGMGDDLRRAKGAGLSWSLPEGMDERALEARLFPGAGVPAPAQRAMPDWARSHRAAAQGGHPVVAVAGVQGRASRWDSVQPVLRALPRLSTSRCPTTPSNSPCPPTTTTSAGRPASTEPPQETPPMLTHPTIDKLHQLRCPAMAAALAEPLHSPHRDALSFEEPLGLLADAILDRLVHNACKLELSRENSRRLLRTTCRRFHHPTSHHLDHPSGCRGPTVRIAGRTRDPRQASRSLHHHPGGRSPTPRRAGLNPLCHTTHLARRDRKFCQNSATQRYDRSPRPRSSRHEDY